MGNVEGEETGESEDNIGELGKLIVGEDQCCEREEFGELEGIKKQ